jgi:hypothetical protein
MPVAVYTAFVTHMIGVADSKPESKDVSRVLRLVGFWHQQATRRQTVADENGTTCVNCGSRTKAESGKRSKSTAVLP